MAQTVKILPAIWAVWVQSLSQENPLEKEMATHSSILAWRIPWTESLAGYSSWGHKESDTTEQLNNNNWCEILSRLLLSYYKRFRSLEFRAVHLGAISPLITQHLPGSLQHMANQGKHKSHVNFHTVNNKVPYL